MTGIKKTIAMGLALAMLFTFASTTVFAAAEPAPESEVAAAEGSSAAEDASAVEKPTAEDPGNADAAGAPQEPAAPAEEITPAVISVDSVAILPATLSLKVGESKPLQAAITPPNADPRVTWSSLNPAVATVGDTTGVVQGVKAGTTTIEVTTVDGGKTATCTVTVTQPVTQITLKSAATLKVGSSTTLAATVAPGDATNPTLTWRSTNASVATVTGNGVVRGVKAGTANIVAAANDGSGRQAVCKITVKPGVQKVALNKTKLTLKKGKTYQLKPILSPSNAYNTAVSWKSSKQKVATVSTTGKVKGKKTGTAQITCTSKDTPAQKAICKVTVKPKAKRVKLNKSKATVSIGRTLKLKATVTPKNAYSKKITWISSNKKVATVTSKGVVKAKKAGKTKITAKNKDSGKKATCKVTVKKRNIQQELNKILKKYPNGSYYTTDGGLPSMYGGSSEILGRCGAFVSYVEGELFGTYKGFSSTQWWWYDGYVETKQVGSAARGKDQIIALLNKAKPGDYIYAHPLTKGKIEHYAIYLGHDANHLYLYEANWDNQAGIRYNAPQTYDWYTDSREVYLYRAKNYEKLYG